MNRNTAQISWRELLLQGLLLFALLVCLFPATFFRGERTVPGALLYEQAPWKHYRPDDLTPVKNTNTYEYLSFFTKLHAAEHMAHDYREWPLWNPLELTGVPLMANYQSAVFSPLRAPHWFLEPFTADTVFLLFRLWLCGVTAYLCARGLGLRAGPARFFSFAYMMSGMCINWFYWPLPEVMALLPVVLLGAEYLVAGRNRKGFATLTIGATLLLFTGHPESAFTACLGVGAYFFLRVALEMRRDKCAWRSVGLAAGAWALALLVCAPQILPFFEYVRNSTIDVLAFEHTISKYSGLPLTTLVCLLVPRFFGMSADGNFWLDAADNSNTTAFLYIGAVTWAGLALLLARGRYSARMRAQIVALTVPCVAGLFLALRTQPIAALDAVPVWKHWYAAFALFGLPLLGAFGIEHWTASKRPLRDIAVPMAVLTIPFLLAIALFVFHRRVLAMQGLSSYVVRQILYAAVFAGLGIAVAAVACIRGVPAKVATSLLVLVLAADLLFASRDLLPTSPREHLFPDTHLTTELQAKTRPVRVSVLTAGIDSGLMQPYRIEQLHGYDPLYPRRIIEFMTATYPSAWEQAERLFSLEYYLFPHGPAGEDAPSAEMEFITTADGIDIFRNPRALPRAFLVSTLEAVPDPDALFQRMHEEDFDPALVALTDAPIDPFTSDTPTDIPGAATIEQWSPNRVAVQVGAPARSVLVLTDAYYPGWKAYAGGEAIPVFPVYHNFRGVIVEPGISRIEFRFQSASFRAGLWMACPALVLMAFWAVKTLMCRSSRKPCEP